MPKFDVCLMNPPYGATGNQLTHLKFTDRCLPLAERTVIVMPFSFVTKLTHKQMMPYREKFSENLLTVEEVGSKCFDGTCMESVAVYVFDCRKKADEKIRIKKNGSEIIETDSLLDLSYFSDYEKRFIMYLDDKGAQPLVPAGAQDRRVNVLKRIPADKRRDYLDSTIVKNCRKLKEYLSGGLFNAGLVVGHTNGAMNGKVFTSRNGQVFDNCGDFEKLFLSLKCQHGYNVMLFKSVKAAENCKVALQNPLLRFTIYRLQDDRHMCPRVYGCVPAIDWEDDRVRTDEGLLEVCGCPADKCLEYAGYCRGIIEKIDSKKRICKTISQIKGK